MKTESVKVETTILNECRKVAKQERRTLVTVLSILIDEALKARKTNSEGNGASSR